MKYYWVFCVINFLFWLLYEKGNVIKYCVLFKKNNSGDNIKSEIFSVISVSKFVFSGSNIKSQILLSILCY